MTDQSLLIPKPLSINVMRTFYLSWIWASIRITYWAILYPDMRRVLENWNGGLSIGGYKLSNLRYADDTTLVATSALELEALLLIVKAKSEALGPRLNVSKTKIMIVGSDGNEDPIVVDGTEVEHVTQFNFLGSLITTSSGCSTELRRRMTMAKSAMVGLNKIWTDRGITKATKKRLVSALIFPIATYGCESWTLTKADQSRITSFEILCWRRMLRISWFMKRSNISVLEEIQPKRRLLSYVQSQMMKYFGHIARRGGDSLEKVIMQGCVEGRRKPGRPRTRWQMDRPNQIYGRMPPSWALQPCPGSSEVVWCCCSRKLSVMTGSYRPTDELPLLSSSLCSCQFIFTGYGLHTRESNLFSRRSYLCQMPYWQQMGL